MWLYIFLISIPILFLWAESASDSEDDVFGIQRAGELRSEEEVDEKGGDEADGMEFENLVNFRDVGRFINDFLGKKLVAENKLFRSARLDDISIEDRRRLRVNYGIKTILDLRSKTEHIVQEQKRQAYLQNPSASPSNAGLALPPKIPGIDYISVKIQGRKYEMSMVWKLSFWSILKMTTCMIFGYRLQGISILVKEAIQPRGLYGLGIDTLDFCGAEISQLFTTISSTTTYPLLVHCTQGKDRTGLIIALILLLLEIPLDAITADYCLSENELLLEKESRLKEIRQIGLRRLGDIWIASMAVLGIIWEVLG